MTQDRVHCALQVRKAQGDHGLPEEAGKTTLYQELDASPLRTPPPLGPLKRENQARHGGRFLQSQNLGDRRKQIFVNSEPT